MNFRPSKSDLRFLGHDLIFVSTKPAAAHRALRQMSVVQAEFTAAYGDHEQNVMRLIESQQSALKAVMTHRDSALAAIERAFSSASSIHQAVGDAQARFQKLEGLSALIDMAAINARLRSNRMVNAQKTMAVLSSAVLETATESREVMTKCALALNQIALTHNAEGTNQIQANVQGFRQDYDNCSNGMLVAIAELAQLSQVRGDVMASLGKLNASLAASRLVAERLAEVLNQLSAVSAQIADVPANFVWPDRSDIMEKYTMESEHVVHARLLGLTEVTPHSAPKIDTLDMVFF